VPRAKRKENLERALEMLRIVDVRKRLIKNLSKGYRQRVGLADSLLHEPEVLILDEPTIGLDPNQIRRTRNLIRSLARRYTVLLSSHILPELSTICDKIGINSSGLSNSEIQVLSTLKQRGDCSLSMLSAVTGMSRSALQRDVEIFLLQRGYMKIEGSRKITAEGVKALSAIEEKK
jgi:ABC-2 type transport system ATP-binding protein